VLPKDKVTQCVTKITDKQLSISKLVQHVTRTSPRLAILALKFQIPNLFKQQMADNTSYKSLCKTITYKLSLHKRILMYVLCKKTCYFPH